MFSLICAWINGWVNNGEACDLRRHLAHYDVTVMTALIFFRTPVELVNVVWSFAFRNTAVMEPATKHFVWWKAVKTDAKYRCSQCNHIFIYIYSYNSHVCFVGLKMIFSCVHCHHYWDLNALNIWNAYAYSLNCPLCILWGSVFSTYPVVLGWLWECVHSISLSSISKYESLAIV